MSDIPDEKPDPVKDYEGYKRWRAAQKGKGGAAPAAAAAPAASEKKPEGGGVAVAEAPTEGGEAKAADAPKAEAPAKAAEAKNGEKKDVWPPPDRPNPLTNYAEYKAWKMKRKAGGKAVPVVAVAAGDSRPRKKTQPHASKFKKKEIDRRNLLLSLGGMMWLLFSGALAYFTALCVRFMFPNVLYDPPTTFKIGPPDRFLPNEVDNNFKSERKIWVVRDPVKIFVLSTVCTHLGCTPNWLAADRKFKCPCHGSGFRFSGLNFEGPAPRPLERYRVYLADDGQIVVDTTKKFLTEASWADPEASIAV